GRQLDWGLFLGIVASIICFLWGVDASIDEFDGGLAYGGLIGLIAGLIVWAILAFVSTIFGWGFGFGPGWYIGLIGLAIGTASGVGLVDWLFVCSKALSLFA